MSFEKSHMRWAAAGAVVGGFVVGSFMADRGPSYQESLKEQVEATMRGQNFDSLNLYIQRAPKSHRDAATERIKYDYKEGYEPGNPKKNELTPGDEVVIHCGILAAQGADISPKVKEAWNKAQDANNSFFGHEREDAETIAATACRDATTNYLSSPAIQTIILPLER